MISDADAHLLIAECTATARIFEQAGTCLGCPVGGPAEAYRQVAARIKELNIEPSGMPVWRKPR